MGLSGKAKAFAGFVAIEHTLFALPFAYAGAILGAGGWPTASQLLWITVAMVGARNAALGLNRIIDRHIDARNPRTCSRHLPAGKLSYAEAIAFTIASLGLLVLAAWMLNPLCVKLLPLVIPPLVLYPYAKRFTWTCHYWMVPAQFFAPFGGWVAVRGEIGPEALILGLAVGLWIAGFDIFYALQDIKFDRENGLFSIPASLGINKALWVARLTHLVVIALLVWLYYQAHISLAYLLAVLLAATILVFQHLMIRSPEDTARAIKAFNLNLVVGPLLFAGIVAGVLNLK